VGGCFQTKSIITPTKFVTVARLSRMAPSQPDAEKRGRSTNRAPAISAG
jgi:hypothetical protein